METVSFEVPRSLVDVALYADTGAFAFVEAKSNLRLTTPQFTKALEHFVTVYLTMEQRYGRPFDTSRDRLILAVGKRCDPRITNDLSDVLLRFQTAEGRPPLAKAATSANERAALKLALSAIRDQWVAEKSSPAADKEISELLSVIRIAQLDVDQNGRDQREAKQILASHIRRGNNTQAWSALCGLSRDRSNAGNVGFGATDIAAAFAAVDIEALIGPANFEATIKSYADASDDETRLLRQQALLVIRGRELNLRAAICAPKPREPRSGTAMRGKPQRREACRSCGRR